MATVEATSAGAMRLPEFLNLVLIDEGVIVSPLNGSAAGNRQQQAVSLAKAYHAKLGAVAGIRRGHLRVSAALDSATNVLTLQVFEAAHLVVPRSRDRIPESYVKARIIPEIRGEAGNKRKTSIVPKTRCPVFQQTLTWALPADIEFTVCMAPVP
jgi:hypothetical protein